MNPPVVMMQPQVVIVQPQRAQWQTELCDCCSDCGVCKIQCPFRRVTIWKGGQGSCIFNSCIEWRYSRGSWTAICQCLGCQVAADMNECCLCGTSMAIRSVYRTRYGIPGSLCDDFCTVLCCPVCALCQLRRDIKRRKEMGIF